MSILFMMLSAVIFANPFAATLDILPDAVGCILMWFSLRRAELFSPELQTAQRSWLRLLALTLADMFCVYGNVFQRDDLVGVLIIVFVFRISEGILLYLAIMHTMDGGLYLGTKFDATGIYLPYSGKKRLALEAREAAREEKLDLTLSRERERYECETQPGVSARRQRYATERYRRKTAKLSSMMHNIKSGDRLGALSRTTLTFIIVRTAACVLPEFSTIAYISTLRPGVQVALADFRDLFVYFGIMISLVFGIIWLCKMLDYINKIRRDKQFISDINDAYEEHRRGHAELYACKSASFSMILFAAAAILTIDPFIDDKNYLPDYLSAAVFVIFFLFMWHEKKLMFTGIAASVLYGAAAFIEDMTVRGYINEFKDFTRTYIDPDAKTAHMWCSIATAATEALFIAVLILVIASCRKVIEKHTGYEREDGGRDDGTVELREKLRHETVVTFILGALSAACSVIYMISLGFNERVIVSDEGFSDVPVYYPTFPQGWMLSLIMSIIFFVYVIKFVADLRDAVGNKAALL